MPETSVAQANTKTAPTQKLLAIAVRGMLFLQP
jgi:hypothetical protein